MKKPLQLVAAFLLCQATSEASVLYQNDFSGAATPGWFQHTWDDNTFAQVWSITPGLESDSGNQYARYDLDIPSLPSNPGAIWSGGFCDFAGAFTSLPAQWQLSFDVSLNTLEPIEVSFTLVTGQFPDTQKTVVNYWIEPANVGWQPIVIDQDTTSVGGFGGSLPVPGTWLTIGLVSQDPSGNPLSISQIGTYDLLLDNVILQSVPEPSMLGFYIVGGALLVGMCRYRNRPKRYLR